MKREQLSLQQTRPEGPLEGGCVARDNPDIEHNADCQ